MDKNPQPPAPPAPTGNLSPRSMEIDSSIRELVSNFINQQAAVLGTAPIQQPKAQQNRPNKLPVVRRPAPAPAPPVPASGTIMGSVPGSASGTTTGSARVLPEPDTSVCVLNMQAEVPSSDSESEDMED
ncbi:hypothetical protein ACP4OV_015169 [Aristida adscensionis]